jgi:flagellar biosynthesis anti-sigma factor FlgM
MRISDIHTQIIVNRYGKAEKTSSASSASAASGKSDNISLSPEAQGFHDALKAAKESDPVNLQKIDEISKRIAKGTYSVSAREVAESMLGKDI